MRRLAVLALAAVIDVAPLRKDCDTLSLVRLEPMLLQPSCSMAHSLPAVSRICTSKTASATHMSTICRSLPFCPSLEILPPFFMLLNLEYL